jgi:hypothetical protein
VLDSDIKLGEEVGSEDSCVDCVSGKGGEVKERSHRQIAGLESAQLGVCEECCIAVSCAMACAMCEVGCIGHFEAVARGSEWIREGKGEFFLLQKP